MWARSLACRAANLVNAQITFRRLGHRLTRDLIEDEPAFRVSHLNHTDIVVGTVICTGPTADTGIVVDDDFAGSLNTMDCTRRTSQHADRIGAVHARVSDHQTLYTPAMTIEARIVVMTHSAGLRTRITPNAAIKID